METTGGFRFFFAIAGTCQPIPVSILHLPVRAARPVFQPGKEPVSVGTSLYFGTAPNGIGSKDSGSETLRVQDTNIMPSSIMHSSDDKPSRQATQDPQEANTAGNKPSDSQPGASSNQHLLHKDGATQQGTTGAVDTPSGNTIPNAANPNATRQSNSVHSTEADAYAQGTSAQSGDDAAAQTHSEPPPPRK
jgi:hypothetical protein